MTDSRRTASGAADRGPTARQQLAIAEANSLAARTLLATLAENGLREIVLCAGSRNTPLIIAAMEHPELRCHQLLDERVAGFFALGLARERGLASCVITTSGSAVANLLPAVVEAAASRIPLLLLSADRPPELRECGAPQTMDQQRLFGTHCRWYFEPQVPQSECRAEAYASTALLAWSRAHGAPAGPVHLNLPFREPLWLADAAGTATPPHRSATALRGVSSLSDQSCDALALRLQHPRTAIICGPLALGEDTPELGAGLATLAQACGWPLVLDGACSFRHGHEIFPELITHSDLFLRVPEARQELLANQLLCFGGTPTSSALARYLGEHEQAEVIRFDEGCQLRDPHHRTTLLVDAAPTAAVRQLLARLSGQMQERDIGWTRRWQALELGAATRADAACAEGLWEGAVARTLVATLPAASLLHVASSMPIRDLDALGGRSGAPLRVHASRGVNGIDGTVSTFWGEASARQDTSAPAVLVVGDLAFQHDLGGVLAASAAPPPGSSVIVVIDNGGGAIFEFLGIRAHPQAFVPHFLCPQARSPATLGQGLGLTPRLVAEPGELRPTLEAALSHPGLNLIVVIVDREQNVRRHHQLWHEVAQCCRELQH